MLGLKVEGLESAIKSRGEGREAQPLNSSPETFKPSGSNRNGLIILVIPRKYSSLNEVSDMGIYGQNLFSRTSFFLSQDNFFSLGRVQAQSLAFSTFVNSKFVEMAAVVGAIALGAIHFRIMHHLKELFKNTARREAIHPPRVAQPFKLQAEKNPESYPAFQTCTSISLLLLNASIFKAIFFYIIILYSQMFEIIPSPYVIVIVWLLFSFSSLFL